MTPKTKRIILVVALLQIVIALGFLALPPVVQALPGRYLVRLQAHPLTSGVMELVTTPIARSLPSAEGSGSSDVAAAEVLEIPGLAEDTAGESGVSAPAPTASPPPPPSATPIQPVADAEPTATAAPPTPTPTFTPSPTPEPLPEQVMLEGLVTIQQGFNNCGPANMAIALQYWGDETTQMQAAGYLKPNEEDRNVSPWQINEYVNEFTTLKSTAHASGTMDLLKRLIAAGFPVVIEKGYEPQQGAEGWYGHYLTVYGYDDEKEEFYSRDTYLGPFDGRPRVDGYDEFMKWWQHFYYTFYVIYPSYEEQKVRQIIPDVLENEYTMWQHTAEIARQELDEDPNNVFTWFNLGVALTRMGQVASAETTPDFQEGDNARYYEEATEAFDRAREIGLPPRTLYYEHRPFMAYYRTGRIQDVLDLTAAMLETPGGRWVEEIYWYRGHGLAATGDLLGAKEAYEKALEVNANFSPAEISLNWVNSELQQ